MQHTIKSQPTGAYSSLMDRKHFVVVDGETVATVQGVRTTARAVVYGVTLANGERVGHEYPSARKAARAAVDELTKREAAKPEPVAEVGDLVIVEQTVGQATSSPTTSVVEGIAYRDDGTLRVPGGWAGNGVSIERDATGYFPHGVIVVSVKPAAELGSREPVAVVEPVVEIADVKPGTVEVEVAELVPGDVLFSVYGDESTLAKVRVLKDKSATVTFDGGRREWLASGPIRVRRGGPAPVKPTNAQAVSRALRAGGVTPVERHRREGASVSRSYPRGTVLVSVDINAPSARQRMRDAVADILDAAGYAAELDESGHGDWAGSVFFRVAGRYAQ